MPSSACAAPPRHLPPFPTRRSSDLGTARRRCRDPAGRRARRGARGVRSPARARGAPGARAMIYRLLAMLALVTLIVGVVVLSGAQRESAAPATVGPLHDPGYAARRARLIQTGSDGRALYTLDAAQIQQQP